MTNYQEGSGPYSEGGGGGYQEGPPYQEGQSQHGGPGGYQVGPYQAGPPPQQTTQYQGGGQQWEGNQGQYQGGGPHGGGGGGGRPFGGRGTNLQVRSTFKTTEFWAYVVVSLAVLIAAAVTDTASDLQGFGARQAWFYVTLLTIGYMLSRAVTKLGGRDRDDHDRH